MKLKKFSAAVVSCLLIGSIFTGCGGGGEKKSEPSSQTQISSDVKIGMIENLNVSEQKLGEILKKYQEKNDVKLSKHDITYYSNLNLMLMGIESKNVNEISTYKNVSDYLVAKNSELKALDNHGMHLKDSFCFALRADETELKTEIDNAVEEMKSDGTLDRLTKEYITGLKKNSDPPAVNIESISGAQTIKIAVTGDLPPMDLILSDGTPAGFNTAILAELGRRIGKNIELVQIESGARASALTSKKVDVIFWAILPVGDDRPSDMDKPQGVEFSSPYFTDEIVHLEMKK